MNRRRLPRLPFAVAVEIRTEDSSAPLHASTRDIGMSGLKVYGVVPLAPGTRCDISIRLNSGDEEAPIRATGEVARCTVEAEDGTACMGIQFLEIDDDSQADLWRVIRYNTPEEPTENQHASTDEPQQQEDEMHPRPPDQNHG